MRLWVRLPSPALMKNYWTDKRLVESFMFTCATIISTRFNCDMGKLLAFLKEGLKREPLSEDEISEIRTHPDELLENLNLITEEQLNEAISSISLDSQDGLY